MSEEFHPSPALINRALADRSHAGTSYDPERRAEQEIAQFVSNVQAVYDHLSAHAKSEAQKAFLAQEMMLFQTGYVAKYNDYLTAKSRCFSVMITGASGFNNRAHDKANSAEDRRYEDMQEFKSRSEKAILRELKKMAVEEAGGELTVLERSIKKAEELQEKMKTCNAIIRKKPMPEAEKVKAIMTATGWEESTARKVLEPDFAGRQGFSFQLTNGSANIRRMKQRLVEMQAKENNPTPTTSQEFPGGCIVDDLELDRVCIFHDQKPAHEVIQALKAEGWHWSPKAMAWMRKRTPQAIESARCIASTI
jgi:hypothetical protein